ncbi:MAG: hypothetical protein IPH31_23800 [Lewinellaceae bacterium]|nr:hypothetical protein [Lewinellaceae bacterium]
MEQSNLIELIRTLNPEEKEQIRQFALPFFNNGKMKACRPTSGVMFEPFLGFVSSAIRQTIFARSPFSGDLVKDRKPEKVMVEAQKVKVRFLLAQRYYRRG